MNDSNEISIKKWMMQSLQTNSWERFDDLHIDCISHKYKNPNTWAQGSIEAFHAGIIARDKFAPDFSLALAIPLNPSQSSELPLINSIESFGTLINKVTPPSLYLFKSNSRNWIDTFDETIQIINFLSLNVEIYYQELLCDEDNEFNRNLWIVSPENIKK